MGRGKGFNKTKIDRIHALIDEGKPTHEIATLCGISTSTVSNYRRRFREEGSLPNSYYDDALGNRIRKLIEADYNFKQIGEITSATKEQIQAVADAVYQAKDTNMGTKKWLKKNWRWKIPEKKEKKPNTVYRGQRGKLRTPYRTDGRFQ